MHEPALLRELVILLAIVAARAALFEIGLELPVDRRRLLRLELNAGALQVDVTLATVSVGRDVHRAFLAHGAGVGALVAVSNTVLVIRLLGERGEVQAPHGQFAVALLLF